MQNLKNPEPVVLDKEERWELLSDRWGDELIANGRIRATAASDLIMDRLNAIYWSIDT